MKKFALLASLMALAAFAAPSAASAVVWGPAGTTSSLDSSAGAPVKYVVPGINAGWQCTGQHMVLSVPKPASSTASVTSDTFSGCVGNMGSMVHCTITQTATKLPWTMQAVSLTDVRLNVGNVNVKFANTPGDPTPCWWAGGEISFSGTLGGGKWNSITHSVAFEPNEATQGLTSPTMGGESIWEYGVFKNNAGTLTLS